MPTLVLLPRVPPALREAMAGLRLLGRTRVRDREGQEAAAWMYVWNGSVDRLVEIPGGERPGKRRHTPGS